MRRLTWICSIVFVVAGSLAVAADGPDPGAKKASPKDEVKAKAKAKVSGKSPAAAVPGQPKPTSSPDPRATSLFRSAQNLDKTGKKPGAIGLYREVLIKYPESPEASQSAARLKALGGKLPDPSEIKPAPPPEEAKFTRVPKRKYASQEANRAALNEALNGMVGSAASQPAGGGAAGGYGK